MNRSKNLLTKTSKPIYFRGRNSWFSKLPLQDVGTCLLSPYIGGVLGSATWALPPPPPIKKQKQLSVIYNTELNSADSSANVLSCFFCTEISASIKKSERGVY